MTKILLVEDDKSLREIYGVRLYSEGYDIVSAGDGEEALAVAIKDRPALIVSDVMMPKISGFDMLDILRSTTETKNIKVIMMTALSSEDQRKRGEELGADRYLVKSQVGIEDVVRTVHEVLGDAPTTAANSPSNPFSTPAPTAVTRPAPSPTPPERQPAPAAASPQPVSTPPQASQAPTQNYTNVASSPNPTPTPTSPQLNNQPQQTSQANPAPAPQQSAQYSQPQPQTPSPTAYSPLPQPQQSSQPSSGLPQPTAPFSTQRPANLADRIIQPLNSVNDEDDDKLSSMMDQELDGSANTDSQAGSQSPAQSASTPQTISVQQVSDNPLQQPTQSSNPQSPPQF